MKEKSSSTFIINILKMVLSKGGLIFVNMLLSIFIARVLSVEEKGNYEMAVTFYSLGLQFCNLGLHSSFTFYLAKDRDKLSEIWGNSNFLVGICTIFILGIIIVYMFNGTLTQRSMNLLIAFLMIPIQLCFIFLYQIFIALDNIDLCNIIEVAKSFVPLIILVVLNRNQGIESKEILFISLVCLLFINIYGNIYILCKYKISPKLNFSLLKEAIPLGIKNYIVNLLAFMMLRIDLFMLNNIAGEGSVGIYSLSVNLIDILLIIPAVIAQLIYLKLIVIDCEKKRYEVAKDIFIKTALAMLAIEIAANIAIPIILPFVYGEKYIASIRPFQHLLVGAFFWGIDSILRNYFNSYKIYKYSIVGISGAVIVNLILNTLFIPSKGIEGAVMASNCSYFLCFLISFVMFVKEEKTLSEKTCNMIKE